MPLLTLWEAYIEAQRIAHNKYDLDTLRHLLMENDVLVTRKTSRLQLIRIETDGGVQEFDVSHLDDEVDQKDMLEALRWGLMGGQPTVMKPYVVRLVFDDHFEVERRRDEVSPGSYKHLLTYRHNGLLTDWESRSETQRDIMSILQIDPDDLKRLLGLDDINKIQNRLDFSVNRAHLLQIYRKIKLHKEECKSRITLLVQKLKVHKTSLTQSEAVPLIKSSIVDEKKRWHAIHNNLNEYLREYTGAYHIHADMMRGKKLVARAKEQNRLQSEKALLQKKQEKLHAQIEQTIRLLDLRKDADAQSYQAVFAVLCLPWVRDAWLQRQKATVCKKLNDLTAGDRFTAACVEALQQLSTQDAMVSREIRFCDKDLLSLQDAPLHMTVMPCTISHFLLGDQSKVITAYMQQEANVQHRQRVKEIQMELKDLTHRLYHLSYWVQALRPTYGTLHRYIATMA